MLLLLHVFVNSILACPHTRNPLYSVHLLRHQTLRRKVSTFQMFSM